MRVSPSRAPSFQYLYVMSRVPPLLFFICLNSSQVIHLAPSSSVRSKASQANTMRYSSTIVAALCATFVSAHPVEKRSYPVAVDFNPPPGGDVTILNYALTLEYLERKFYQEGITKFSRKDFQDAGFPDPFYDNLLTIYFDEQVSSSCTVS